MKRIIEKAAVLIEALPWIQRFRGTTTVIKLGGSAMESQESLQGVLTDAVFMHCVGLRPVIVHGGGKAISAEMRKRGLEARFVAGMRVTDEDAIRAVEDVLDGRVNGELVRRLAAAGSEAVGVSGRRVLRARRLTLKNRETGVPYDLGFVGEVVSVDPSPIEEVQAADKIPVVSPLATGEDGRTYNVNADAAAAEIAVRLRATKLVFLSDVPGILAEKDREESLLSTVHADEVENLIHGGIIRGGMMPKVRGATKAIKSGVSKTHIIDGRLRHSLLLEIFTDAGVGTEIVQ